MLNLNLSRTFGLFLALLAICFGLQAQAEYDGGSGTIAPAQTSTYVFLPDQSTVVKTGGIAGVHETYPIQGQFQLTVDASASVASFDYVDAFLLSPISSSPPQSLCELLNMTELQGTIVNDALIEFTGKTADNTNTDIALTLRFTDDAVQLTGQTIPPPNSADFFIFELDATALKKYGGGTGEPNDPYLIYTAEQMNAIGANTSDYYKHFKLMADIDFSSYTGTDFNIIGYWRNWGDQKSFAGVFDGNGHTISHLTIEGGSYLGLFGWLGGAEIKNLGLVDVNVTSSGDRIGGLVGKNSSGIITNCYAMGTITGNKYVGGLVGINYGYVTNCCSSGVVSGEHYVGGLVGNEHRQIYDCYSTTNVSGRECVGGLVGLSWKGTITNCYSVGRVTGMTDVGGLIGLNYSNVYSSFWDIEASGQMTSAGGMGKTTAEMQDSKSLMDAGWDFVGAPDGPSDIWAEPAGGGYPILWWQLSPLPALPTFSGGTGMVYDPYLISIGSELNSIGYNPRLIGAHFKLIDDIDMTGIDFFIIGNWSSPFTGVFDGNGHAISNFTYISTDANRVALFGDIHGENAEIKDLRLIDPNIDAGSGSVVGSLVAGLRDGTITGCYVEGGNVAGNEIVGGLVGFNYYGDILNCYSSVSVSGFQFVGGLVGNNNIPVLHPARITNSYSVGSVTGTKCVGGLVGRNNIHHTVDTITHCYSTSNVMGREQVGGLVGIHAGISSFPAGISSSYATGNVSGDREIGGLVGFNQGTIINCYYMGSVSGDDFVGGLVGSSCAHTNDCYITNCYSSGMVIGDSYVGGLVGINESGTPVCFFFPEMSCRTPTSNITECYSNGYVTGDSKVGGLVGENDGKVDRSFWDIEASGQMTSAGGAGKTTAEMQVESTLTDAGWDFVDESTNGTEDIWSICEGTNYPRLVWQIPAGDFVCPDGITIDDFVFFTEYWGQETCDLSNDHCQGTDLNHSGTVDTNDLEIFLENWLKER